MNQNQPMMPAHSAVSKWLWITLIVVILLAAGFFAWYYLYGPGKTVATITTPTPTATTTDETADWKTYTNTANGFSLKYPKDWFTDTADASSVVIISNHEKASQYNKSNNPADLLKFGVMEYTEAAQTADQPYIISQIPVGDVTVYSLRNPEDTSSKVTYQKVGKFTAGGKTWKLYMNTEVGADLVQKELTYFDKMVKTIKITTATSATADWKTYTSNPSFTDKYTFKYPTDYTAVDSTSELDGGAHLTKDGNTIFSFGFLTGTKEDAIKSYSDLSIKMMQTVTATKTVKVGSIDATEITGKLGTALDTPSAGKNGSLVILSNKDRTYLIVSVDADNTTIKNNFTNILSTFTFTN